MSDEKKTLGQVFHEHSLAPSEAKWEHCHKAHYERQSAGIAAVCRAVMDENAKASIDDRPDVAKWTTTKDGTLIPEREPPKPEAEFHDAGTITGGAAGTPVAKPEVGDWAMEAWLDAYEEWGTTEGSCDVGKSESEAPDNIAAAKVIREAAERHYGEKIATLGRSLRLEQELSISRLQGIEMLTKERDAARAECERLKSECTARSASLGMAISVANALADERDSTQPAAPPSPAADATGEDELEGDALREAVISDMAKALKDVFSTRPMSQCVEGASRIMPLIDSIGDLVRTEMRVEVKRAEAAEAERDKLTAELVEVREACEWIYDTCAVSRSRNENCWKVWRHGSIIAIGKDATDAILAAWRTTKGTDHY